jgi:hypothetical protein
VQASTPFVQSFQWRDDGSVEESGYFAGQISFGFLATDKLLVIEFAPRGTF